MEDNNKKDFNAKILEKKYHKNIYNEKKGKNPFLLQFKQLKYYYNLGKKLKNNISLGYISQEDDKNEYNPSRNISINLYGLIDRKWLKKWKKHIGYKEIKNKIRENKIERDLDNNDYKWISEIIDKNYKDNCLYPLENNTIYKDNEINPLADFKVIHKDSLKLFNIISKSSVINNNFRKYPLSFFKNKYIMILNNDRFFIVFKNSNSHIFNEIIIDFIEIRENNNKSQNKEYKVSNKKKIIDILFNKDINEWLNEINFKFTEIEKELEYNNCKIKIYNKTLLRKCDENQIRNSISPNINDERNELLNSNILSNGLTKIIDMQSKINQFMIRDIKPIDNNNNFIRTNMVFDNINEKKLKDCKFNLDNDKQKENNNNIIKENNNINNQKIDILNSPANNIINPNNDNNNQSYEKEIYINPEFENEQINSFDNNQSLIQNKNNNFNYNNNQNIYQNDNNDYISNYNNQNQIQCNNNNIIQSNNNQVLFSNNNMFLNNNYNNQSNNQIFNSNNEQNNMNPQNILQTKLILMEQDKKNIENIKNKEIYELKKKINELENEVKIEKDKNKLLKENINSLKKELNEVRNKKKYLEKSIENKDININELNKIIVVKEKKMSILEKKLSRFPFELKEEEKLMTVIFTTMDQKFHYSIICKNSDIFNTIENKLYDVFSEYSETENYFLLKGNKINKVKTLEYNKIQNNDLIILKQIDEIK